jgi:hypothetical protein
MGDESTSPSKKFLFERQFNVKRTLVFDLTIDSGDEEQVSETEEQPEGHVAVLRVSGKLNPSTPIVRVQEGQKKGKFLTKEDSPPIIYGIYGPRLRGFYHAFQVTFEEFGSIIQISNKGIKTAKANEDDPDLFTLTTFEYFEDKDHYSGYDRYVLSIRLWLSLQSEELECNTRLSQANTSFKLVQALPNQDLSVKISRLEVDEWEDLNKVPKEEIQAIARNCRAPLSIYTLIKNHQELGTPKETGDYFP